MGFILFGLIVCWLVSAFDDDLKPVFRIATAALIGLAVSGLLLGWSILALIGWILALVF